MNHLYLGDCLSVLPLHVPEGSIELCYIDPPYCSQRDFDAFADVWTWNEKANRELAQVAGANSATALLVEGFYNAFGQSGLLAYLIAMTLRITEIHRVLKPTGSFYLHCDPTASHYLKLVLDAVFVSQGGDFRNEIIWAYRKWSVAQSQFPRNHDVILFYTKSKDSTFNTLYTPVSDGTMKRWKGKKQQAVFVDGVRKAATIDEGTAQTPIADWWEVSILNPAATERLGYPTQKPEALLERIIRASSNEGDVVLDAFCGCGTTVAVAQRLNRKWIGIDKSAAAMALARRRIECLIECPSEMAVKL